MIILGNDPATQPSFSLSNRLARGLWSAVWWAAFRPTPRPFHAWRAFVLRRFGAKIGKHVHVYPSVKIWAPWNLVIQDRVGVGDGATLYNIAPIVIERNAVVSQGAHLCTGTHDIESENFQLIARPIKIGPYAWVCAEAFIGPGVSVSEGCVIGARTVMFRSTPHAWQVWQGNPGAPGRMRRRYPELFNLSRPQQ